MSPDDRAWELIEKIDVCMLVTLPAAGPRARPMSSVVRRDRGLISFLADRDHAKDDEIAGNPDVCLTYSNGSSQFVSITGRASLTDDPAIIRDLWTPSAGAFWPNGPDDPSIVAIDVQPVAGEFWDGPVGVVAAFRLAFGAVTGARPDLGTNEKFVPGQPGRARP